MITNYICPVCGYDNLYEPAYDGPVGSMEFCPSCRFQFGVTDDDRHISFEQWRQQWIANGMVWDKGRTTPPAGWDPGKQLLNVIGGNG